MLYREKSFRGHGVGKRHCLYENLMKEARILQKFYFNIFLNSFLIMQEYKKIVILKCPFSRFNICHKIFLLQDTTSISSPSVLFLCLCSTLLSVFLCVLIYWFTCLGPLIDYVSLEGKISVIYKFSIKGY